jgi:hypothetical protein
MKTYRGWREGYAALVTVDGRSLNPRLDLWNHSPTGFEWGYAGSGPSQLALAMLADHLGDDGGIENATLNESASYIQGWLSKLKEDRKLVVHAAAQAQKACDYILDVKHAEEEGSAEQQPKEYKVVALRDCPMPEHMQVCDTSELAAEYWRRHVTTASYFNPECECLVVLLLNTRRRIKGHHLVSIGLLDTILAHPREVFRPAIAAAASVMVTMHSLCAAAQKLRYMVRLFMCSRRLLRQSLLRPSGRRACCGFA